MAEQPLQPLRRRLTLEDARAVGGPVALTLLASYFALSLIGWLAAAVALAVAVPRLVVGDLGATAPVLAVHLLALGFLPLAVSGGTFHLLPVMLRNPLPSKRRLWAALPLLALGASLVAPGVAYDVPAALWPGAALLASGLGLVLWELGGLVARAPRGRMLVASRTGVTLSLFHVLAALTFGAVVFDHGDAPMLGVSHDRWLLVHLHLAALGWLALLIVAVGRTLGPMLALAPAARPRKLPLEELLLTLGLWLLLAGIAADTTALAYAGAALVLLALGRFGALILRIGRTRRIELEGPLLHLLAGGAFLTQAAALGLALLAGAAPQQRGIAAYVLLLLLGWAAGVTLGHLPKLLSLSIWVWWPPGPRPKQDALYPRRLAQLEAVVFAAGVEITAIGIYAGSSPTARAGSGLVAAAALLAAATTAVVWQRRNRMAPATE
ncbi:MAG TPA: hypothetical protein VFM57_05845 [Thermoleophilaceae bacterium]|nr:hypothetical protein [Thermoleophilaceae bacterium]